MKNERNDSFLAEKRIKELHSFGTRQDFDNKFLSFSRSLYTVSRLPLSILIQFIYLHPLCPNLKLINGYNRFKSNSSFFTIESRMVIVTYYLVSILNDCNHLSCRIIIYPLSLVPSLKENDNIAWLKISVFEREIERKI